MEDINISLNIDSSNDTVPTFTISDDYRLVRYIGNESEIRIPDGVRVIGNNAFKGNGSVKRVIMSDTVVEVADSAFAGCKKLKCVDNILSVTEIGDGAFLGCRRLERICLHDNIAIIGKQAFKGCNSLSIIRIPTGLRRLGTDAFADCPLSEEIKVGLDRFYQHDERHRKSYRQRKSRMNTSGIISGSGDKRIAAAQQTEEKIKQRMEHTVVKLAREKAFSEHNMIVTGQTLTNYLGDEQVVVVPDGINRIASRAFDNKPSLACVVFEGDILKISQDAFVGCRNVRVLIFKKQIKNIERAFIPSDARVVLVKADDDHEPEYVKTKNVTLITANVDEAYEHIIENKCLIVDDSLITVPFDCERFELPSNIVHIYPRAFSRRQIKYIVLNEGLVSIGEAAFEMCTKLVAVSLPSTLKSIETNAFMTCSMLRQLVIPESVERIEEKAFCNCNKLEMIVFKNEPQSISKDAIYQCVGLKFVAATSRVTRQLLLDACPQISDIIR